MKNNHPSCVSLLVSNSSVILDRTTEYGFTPLHYACDKNAVACVAIYVKAERCTPAMINIKSKYGATALMDAVIKQHLDCVKELEKIPGVDFATYNDIEFYLKERKSARTTESTDNTTTTSSSILPIYRRDNLEDACRYGDTQLLKNILDGGYVDINCDLGYGETALHKVMKNNHPSCVSLLVSNSSVILDRTNEYG